MNDTRKILEARLNLPPKSSLEATRSFLQTYFGDALSLEEVRASLERITSVNHRAALESLCGIESLILNPPLEKGVLAEMIAWDANWVLDDPTDQGAKVFLREVAKMIREVLGDRQPPRLTQQD